MLQPKTIDRLMEYHWPGNVRELENLVERALIQYRGGILNFDSLLTPQTSASGERARSGVETIPALTSLDEMNAQYIKKALTASGGKIHGSGGAAALLGINPSTLRKKMIKLGISFGRRKNGYAHI